MRKLFLLVLAIAAAYFGLYDRLPNSGTPAVVPASTQQSTNTSSGSAAAQSRNKNSDALQRAFDNQQSNVQVQATGVVDKVLSDDNDGSRHQRFIVKMPSGQTVLIAHNIDLAKRVASLSVGDSVQFFGEYEYNDRGGVVHWTHRDPGNRHESGWLKHRGQTYQ